MGAPDWLSALPAARPLLPRVAAVPLPPGRSLPTALSVLGPHSGHGPVRWPSLLQQGACLYLIGRWPASALWEGWEYLAVLLSPRVSLLQRSAQALTRGNSLIGSHTGKGPRTQGGPIFARAPAPVTLVRALGAAGSALSDV